MKNLTKSMVFLQLVIITMIIFSGVSTWQVAGDNEAKLVPVGGTEYRMMSVGLHGTPFRQCGPCKCCSGSECQSMSCCFGIKCNLPGKPYGQCAFTPLSCDCKNCGST